MSRNAVSFELVSIPLSDIYVFFITVFLFYCIFIIMRIEIEISKSKKRNKIIQILKMGKK